MNDDQPNVLVVAPDGQVFLVRINPDFPTASAGRVLRFWAQFNDQQIADVLGSLPTELETPKMTTPTADPTPVPLTLESSSFTMREFLGADPTDPSVIIGLVDTDESEEHFLGLEANLRIGDGDGYAEIDLSVLQPLSDTDDRVNAYNAIVINMAKASSLLDSVGQFVRAYQDAALEALSVVTSYGDEFQDVVELED